MVNSGTATSVPESFRLYRLTVADGLSQNSVTAILQDRRGLLWFGTLDGLNCFDGRRFTIYKTVRNNENSLSSGHITALCEDQDGSLWIGTQGGGLCNFDASRSRFGRYLNDPEQADSLPDDSVNALCLDQQGTLWVGTPNGLCSLASGTKSFVRYPVPDRERSQGTSHEYISALVMDRAGNLWIGTYKGLDCRDVVSRRFKTFPFRAGTGQAENFITSLHLDPTGSLWVCSQQGLDRFNPAIGRFERILASDNIRGTSYYGRLLDSRGVIYIGHGSEFLLYDTTGGRRQEGGERQSHGDTLFSAFEDRAGTVWLGTGRGVAQMLQPTFAHYLNVHDGAVLPNVNSIHSFAEDGHGRVWVGSQAGLARWDRQTGNLSQVRLPFLQADGNVSASIMGIIPDPLGSLWLATSVGLVHMDPATGRFTMVSRDSANLTRGLTHDHVRCILCDRDGYLWAGCSFGLNRLSPDGKVTGQYWNRTDDPFSLSHNGVLSLLEDRQGAIWVGTNGGGLNRLKADRSGFFIYRHQPGQNRGPSSNVVLAIHQDVRGQLWLGTSAGLDRFDLKKGEFKNYSEQDGLPNNMIHSILEDDRGRLWLSTNRGLCRFDTVTEKISTYGLSHGVQDLEFNLGAGYRCRDGSLLFGGVNGFNHFDPRHIVDNTQPPAVLITRVEVMPRRLLLTGGIQSSRELVVLPGDTLINLEFAALSYQDSKANRFAYKIEDLHGDWIDLGNAHSLSLSGLPVGRHLFRVKAANADGLWNETGVSLVLAVRPPFYRSWWFVCLLGLVLALGSYYLGVTHRRRVAGRIQSRVDLKEKGSRLGLSPREQEIVLLVLAGKTNKDIENELFIAGSTVKNHIQSVYRKLSVKNRTQLVNFFKNLRS